MRNFFSIFDLENIREEKDGGILGLDVDNIKVGLKEVRCDDVDCMGVE